MKFWDSSALIPLLVDERSTRALLSLLATDPNAVVAFTTPIELASVITRRAGADEASRRMLDVLEGTWTIADEYEAITRSARRLASRYGLRSGDAIQLSAALTISPSASIPIVTLDHELATAALAEGFTVLPKP